VKIDKDGSHEEDRNFYYIVPKNEIKPNMTKEELRKYGYFYSHICWIFVSNKKKKNKKKKKTRY
jgi:hypothetical protein